MYYQYTEQITTLAHVNLTGDINETPVVILENKLEPDVHFDLNSRMDRFQRAKILNVDAESEALKKYYLRPSAEFIAPFAKTNFSASTLSDFANCPFKFFSQSGLGFRDEENLSIDLGFQQRGLVFHALFDYLSKKDFKFTIAELEAFLDQCRGQYQLYLRSDILWSAFKKKMIKTKNCNN